jgi:hypothetical protein
MCVNISLGPFHLLAMILRQLTSASSPLSRDMDRAVLEGRLALRCAVANLAHERRLLLLHPSHAVDRRAEVVDRLREILVPAFKKTAYHHRPWEPSSITEMPITVLGTVVAARKEDRNPGWFERGMGPAPCKLSAGQKDSETQSPTPAYRFIIPASILSPCTKAGTPFSHSTSLSVSYISSSVAPARFALSRTL